MNNDEELEETSRCMFNYTQFSCFLKKLCLEEN